MQNTFCENIKKYITPHKRQHVIKEKCIWSWLLYVRGVTSFRFQINRKPTSRVLENIVLLQIIENFFGEQGSSENILNTSPHGGEIQTLRVKSN